MSKRFHPVKVTPWVYTKIKESLDIYHMPRKSVCDTYHICETTAKYIDQSSNYRDYQRILSEKNQRQKVKTSKKVERSRKMRESGLGTAIIIEYNKQRRYNRQKMMEYMCIGLAVGILIGFFVFVLVGGAR